MIIFDPLGDIYSCWDVVGQREYRVGHYMPDFVLEDTFADKWFDSRVSKFSCIKCKYVLFAVEDVWQTPYEQPEIYNQVHAMIILVCSMPK